MMDRVGLRQWLRGLSPQWVGGAVGMAAVLALLPVTGTALGMRAAALRDHARLAAEEAAPERGAVPLVVPGAAMAAPDARGARAALIARIRRQAAASGILVEELGPVTAPGHLAAVRLRVSGAENAVVALADGWERGRPLLRLHGWTLEPLADGGVRLSAVVVGPWAEAGQ